jgi:hypothetical protein
MKYFPPVIWEQEFKTLVIIEVRFRAPKDYTVLHIQKKQIEQLHLTQGLVL